MAGDDDSIRADQDWIDEAEFFDRGRDLRYLLIGVGAGVAGVREELVEGPALDGVRHLHRKNRSAYFSIANREFSRQQTGTSRFTPSRSCALTRSLSNDPYLEFLCNECGARAGSLDRASVHRYAAPDPPARPRNREARRAPSATTTAAPLRPRDWRECACFLVMKTKLTDSDPTALFVKAERAEERGDLKTANELLLAAAQLGHTGAQVLIGNNYASGRGIGRSSQKAAYWYRRAYWSGDESGALNLAIDKLKARHRRAAILWLKRAIKLHSGEAALELAKLYLGMRGGERKAIDLLKMTQRMRPSEISDQAKDDARNLLASLHRNLDG